MLLGRYARAEDVVVGTPLANRSRPELEGLIGYFVNTVALRTDLSGTQPSCGSFVALLGSALKVVSTDTLHAVCFDFHSSSGA